MKTKFLYYTVSVVLLLATSIYQTNAWIGLVAEAGDILNIAKWNELVTELDQKIEPTNLVEGTSITLTQSGSDVTINSNAAVAPFLTPDNIQLVQNTNYTIDISGVYFTPTTTVSIPGFDGTINSVSAVDPNTLQLDITMGPTITDYDIILDNGGELNTLWSGNGVNYLSVIAPVTGTGPAGTYTEGFETGLGNWVNTGGSQPWTRDSGGTPSNGTGPLTGGLGSTWYVFTEASGANSPNVDFAIQTTNFNIAQSISFDYHMIGAAMGTLELQTLYSGSWTTRWTISGSQQGAQGDPYINQTVNLSTFPVEAVRFVGTSGATWSSDIAIDNLVITSI